MRTVTLVLLTLGLSTPAIWISCLLFGWRYDLQTILGQVLGMALVGIWSELRKRK